jgi:hypothetical protein
VGSGNGLQLPVELRVFLKGWLLGGEDPSADASQRNDERD